MKQETLEEAAKKYATNHGMMAYVFPEKEKSFIDGAKWQQQNSYSEEEAGELVYNIMGEYAKHYGIMIDGTKLDELFEQFKKK